MPPCAGLAVRVAGMRVVRVVVVWRAMVCLGQVGEDAVRGVVWTCEFCSLIRSMVDG